MAEELYDIYGTWHIPFWQTTAFYGVVGLFIGLLVLWIIWRLIKKYIFKEKKQTAWETALKKLEQLRTQKIANAQYGKKFYNTLTSIIKQYLHDRFAFDVHGKTDEELLVYLEQKHFSSDLLEDVRAIAQGGTLIKFANVQAVQEQIDRDLERSIQLVKKTIPEKSEGIHINLLRNRVLQY